jgi:hypothetical protein
VISDTELRDVWTDCSYDPRNLVTEHRRRWNDIVSSEKQVGVTQPGRPHLDEDFVCDRRSDVNVFKIKPMTQCIQDKRFHICPRLCDNRDRYV